MRHDLPSISTLYAGKRMRPTNSINRGRERRHSGAPRPASLLLGGRGTSGSAASPPPYGQQTTLSRAPLRDTKMKVRCQFGNTRSGHENAVAGAVTSAGLVVGPVDVGQRGNIALWCLLYRHFYLVPTGTLGSAADIELMLFLCAAYVFGCAFRSVLPRADVQRICLFDTWLSSVVIGRSVATVAEISFAAQWAIVLRQLGTMAGADTTIIVASVIVPLIVVAQCCSWYGVLTTNYLGNAIENSIWAIAFLTVGIALCRLLPEFEGLVRLGLIVAILGITGYLGFSYYHRCPNVPQPVARRPCRWAQNHKSSPGSPRRVDALGRDA